MGTEAAICTMASLCEHMAAGLLLDSLHLHLCLFSSGCHVATFLSMGLAKKTNGSLAGTVKPFHSVGPNQISWQFPMPLIWKSSEKFPEL